MGDWPGVAALVGVQGAVLRRDGIEGGTAGEEGMGLGRAAVVGQVTEHGITGIGRLTAVVFDQVVGIGADDTVVVEHAITTVFEMVGDESIGIVQGAFDRNAAARFACHFLVRGATHSGILGDGAVGEGDDAADIDPTTPPAGLVPADGAIAEAGRALAGDVQTAAILLGPVMAEGAVGEGEGAPFDQLDGAAAATFEAGRGLSIGGVVTEGGIENLEGATLVDNTPAAVGPVVTDNAVGQGQGALVQDTTTVADALGRVAVADGHGFEDHRRAFGDGKDAVGGLAGLFVSLDNGLPGALALDGDVFVNEDAGFGVNGVGQVDDVAGDCSGIVKGGLDGGEVAANGAHGDRVQGRQVGGVGGGMGRPGGECRCWGRGRVGYGERRGRGRWVGYTSSFWAGAAGRDEQDDEEGE